jgi:hypothetical protein
MSTATAPAMRPEIEARVRRFVSALESSDQAEHVLTVMVAGSACRGEEVWRDGQLMSDIDLMLVTRRTNPHRTRKLAAIMSQFRADGIDGGPTPLTSLRRFRTFAFYEARTTGIVVWGNHHISSLLPPISASDLPRWEAIRVLANRMFEHLKVACGQASPAHATAKSYEALAEAALALEGRYRPSYHHRLVEVTRNPPALLSPSTCRAAVAVLRARLQQQSIPMPTADLACHDLLSGLRGALGHYLQADGSVGELLSMLGQREHHWRHRLYWACGHPGYAMSPCLRVDPIIVLWQQAAGALLAIPTADTAKELVDAWMACPQILRHHDAEYASETRAGTSGVWSDHR